MIIRGFAMFTPYVISGSVALAQSGAPIETELSVESTTILMPVSDSDSSIDAEAILGELSILGSSEKVLENGLRVRARGALRLQYDHPNRPGGTGGFGVEDRSATGAFSGLSAARPDRETDMRARLETAYLQVDGGYGELRFGKDRGVAARFFEGPRSALSHVRADSALLDPTGLSTARTRHDLTGPSPKVSYASPRLIGIRAGASFTPDASADGLDRRPSAGTGGLSPEVESALELALNGTRRLRESGVRLDVSLAWSTAEAKSTVPLSRYERVETWSAGTRIEREDWTLGLSWLDSTNGVPDNDYRAWSAGLHRETQAADFSIEYSQAEDSGVRLDSTSWRAAAGRDFSPTTRVSLAYLNDRITTPLGDRRSQGIVVEITLSQEIHRITGN